MARLIATKDGILGPGLEGRCMRLVGTEEKHILVAPSAWRWPVVHVCGREVALRRRSAIAAERTLPAAPDAKRRRLRRNHIAGARAATDTNGGSRYTALIERAGVQDAVDVCRHGTRLRQVFLQEGRVYVSGFPIERANVAAEGKRGTEAITLPEEMRFQSAQRSCAIGRAEVLHVEANRPQGSGARGRDAADKGIRLDGVLAARKELRPFAPRAVTRVERDDGSVRRRGSRHMVPIPAAAVVVGQARRSQPILGEHRQRACALIRAI